MTNFQVNVKIALMLSKISLFLGLFFSLYGAISYNLVHEEPDIFIDSFSEKIGVTWQNGAVWDKPLIEKVYHLLKEKDEFFVVFDVGAQTGAFTLLSKFFPFSKWHSFEPIEEAANTLEENLRLNEIKNVAVHKMAASHYTGKAMLNLPNISEWGLATIGANPLRFSKESTREIICIDLDRFVRMNQIEKVDFIKIDTEGWEFFVLQGAFDLIMRDRPLILMEYNLVNMQQCGVKPEEIENLLRSMGYQWSFISSEDILCLPLP